MAQFVSQDLEIDEVVVVAAKHHEYAMGIQGAFQTAFEGLDGKVVETIGIVWWTTREAQATCGTRKGFGVRLVASSGDYRQLLSDLQQQAND